MIQDHTEGLTSVYGVKADETHTSLFLQVLELTLPVAAHSTVNLPQGRESDRAHKSTKQNHKGEFTAAGSTI